MSVYVAGTGGLGNSLFQIASAIYYCETYDYKLILLYTPEILFGTANMFNRQKCHIQNGEIYPYTRTIFRKIPVVDEPEAFTEIENSFSANRPFPRAGNIKITGWCQNPDLFMDVFHAIPRYLNLRDEAIEQYIAQKYGDVRGATMIGVRRGLDFAHMTKITDTSYRRALEHLESLGEPTKKLFVIGDVSAPLDLGGRPYTEVNESDIVQFYLGLSCKNFILSESTFHLWIAYLATDPAKKVVCFKNTDITNRRLEMPEWIQMEF